MKNTGIQANLDFLITPIVFHSSVDLSCTCSSLYGCSISVDAVPGTVLVADVDGDVDEDADDVGDESLHFLSAQQALPPDICMAHSITLFRLCPNVTSPKKSSLTTPSRKAPFLSHSLSLDCIFFLKIDFPSIIHLLIYHLPHSLEFKSSNGGDFLCFGHFHGPSV